MKKYLIIISGLILTTGVVSAEVFKGPSATPPNANANLPVNTSNAPQSKSGGLGVGALLVENNTVLRGNVGIGGDINNSYRLNVEGDINFTGDLYKNGVLFQPGGGGNNNATSLWVNNGNNIFRDIGNVGIGTNNPQYTLEVNGDFNLSGNFYQNGQRIDLSSIINWINSGAGSGSGAGVGAGIGGGTGTSLWSSQGNNIFYDKGNVGIGTTPSSWIRLNIDGKIVTNNDISQAANGNGFVMHSRAAQNYDFWQLAPISNNRAEWNKGITLVRGSGSVGIGITNPEQKLTVNGNIKIKGADLAIWNNNRGGNNASLGRALVHDGQGNKASSLLRINYARDFGAGSMFNGGVGINVAPGNAQLNIFRRPGFQGVVIASPEGNTHLPWTDNWNYISGKGVIFRNEQNQEVARVAAMSNYKGELNVRGDVLADQFCNRGGECLSIQQIRQDLDFLKSKHQEGICGGSVYTKGPDITCYNNRLYNVGDRITVLPYFRYGEGEGPRNNFASLQHKRVKMPDVKTCNMRFERTWFDDGGFAAAFRGQTLMEGVDRGFTARWRYVNGRGWWEGNNRYNGNCRSNDIISRNGFESFYFDNRGLNWCAAFVDSTNNGPATRNWKVGQNTYNPGEIIDFYSTHGQGKREDFHNYQVSVEFCR